MTISEAAQNACDKLQFTDATTIAIAKKFAVRRYNMLWDACLWNDTLGVVSVAVNDGDEVIVVGGDVEAAYNSDGNAHKLDLVVAVRFTVSGDIDGTDIPAADWQSFFQLDPNTWNNVASRKSTPTNFVNLPRQFDTALYGQSGVPKIKLVPTPDAAGTLFILGKQQSPTRQNGETAAIAADYPFTIRGCENAIMAYVEGDLLEYSRQYGKAQAKFAEASAHVGVMKDMERGQQQQISRIIPDSDGAYDFHDII